MKNLKDLFQTKSTINESVDVASTPGVSGRANNKTATETYHQWGVRWSGIAGGTVAALAPALQSCYTQNVRDQRANAALQAQNQQNLKAQIATLEGQRDSKNLSLNSAINDKEKIQQKIEDWKNEIDKIKSGEGKNNIMSKVNFYIGTAIVILLALYLFIFYSSASFSAFFGNPEIYDAGQAIFDPHCYEEAAANGFGQLLLILLMPIIFLGLGFLIHQFSQNENGAAKYLKCGGLYAVTFIFDALLAFEISEKIYNNTVLNGIEYTVSMAFNSPNFWIIIFAGFIAYVIWGLVFDSTLNHLENMHLHTAEINALNNKIADSINKIDDIDKNIDILKQDINSLETKIQCLKTQLQNGFVIDKNLILNSLSNFFNGWRSFMHLNAATEADKREANEVYNSFITNIPE